MIEFSTVPTNKDLYYICEQQWNEIEYLKQENEELKKDIAELSKILDEQSKMLDECHTTMLKSVLSLF